MMNNTGQESVLVKYSFDGINFSSDYISSDRLKSFKDAFLNNEVFIIKRDMNSAVGESPFLGSACNEKFIDMSKVVVIGF